MAPHTPQRSERPGGPVALLDPACAHRSTWGAPRWPLTPPDARSAPGNPWRSSIIRVLIDRRGGPRDGPPASSSEGGYAPLGLPRPTLGRALAEPWRASGLTQDVSSRQEVRHEDDGAGEHGQRV